MGKIFFSYSWAQDALVTEVADSLGRDFVIQDKYNFEEGNKLDDEMKNKIKSADMFVLFLSKNSISSKNVQLELDYVLRLVASNRILFCPILIDDSFDISSDLEEYEWIKDYLLTLTTNVPRIKRVIIQKIRSLWCKKFGTKTRFFKGRLLEKKDITSDYFYSIDGTRRAVIVSGIPNIGRKSLLIDTLLTSIDTSLDPNYEPISISLDETDSVDIFIEQLGEYSSIENINSRLSKGDYIKLLVDILNSLQQENQRIIVDDKKCIVQSNGRLVDWFIDVIKNPDLVSYTYFLIASEISIAPEIVRSYKQIQTYRLYPLTNEDMRTIFTSYAKERKVSCTAEDSEFFIKSFNGYPKLILNVVDDIAKSGPDLAKRWLKNNLKIYDSTNRELLDTLKEDTGLYNLVLTLSRFEYLSYDVMCELLPDIDITDKLEKLYYWSLSENFGGQYYRLNKSLTDYINRNRIPLDPSIEQRIVNLGEESLKNLDTNYLDLSEKLFVIKEKIRNNPGTVSLDLLLPSFALKVIIELYRKKDYPNVLILALRLLNDPNNAVYDSVKRSVQYWLCLAAARNAKSSSGSIDIFNNYVDFFYDEKGYNATFFFLKGFFERCNGNYISAKKFYENSLKCHKDSERKKYQAKVHHELALVYMKLEDPRALDFARGNFESAKDNAYHIETYYRCLVRSENPDINTLDDLLQRVRDSHDIYKEVILETFEAEYDYYINNDYRKAVSSLMQTIKNYPRTIQYPIDALKYINKCENSKGKKQKELEQFLKTKRDVEDIYRFDD